MNTVEFLNKLETSLFFHGVPRQSFGHTTAIIDNQFYLLDEDVCNLELLSTRAGGTITYQTPVHFQLSNFPYAFFIYGRQGKANVLYKETEYHLSDGDIMIVPAAETISVQITQSPVVFNLYFISGTVLAPYLSRLTKENSYLGLLSLEPTNQEYIIENMQQLDRILMQPSVDHSFYMHKFLSDILTECIFLSDAKQDSDLNLPKHVRYMKDAFDQRYQESHSLEDFEYELGISRYRLCRDFSNTVGISPIQYLNQVRINKAKALLHQDEFSIRVVGEEVGIDNTNHFIRLFEKTTGTTPLKYRQTIRHLC